MLRPPGRKLVPNSRLRRILMTLSIFLVGLATASRGHSASIEPLLPQDLMINTTSPASAQAEVAFDGGRYLVVWSQETGDGSGRIDVFGRFIGPSGSLEGLPFAIGSGPRSNVSPSVAFNGSDYLVVWRTFDFTINARLVSTDGNLLGSEVVLTSASNTRFDPAVASDGTDFLVVWTDARSFDNNFFDVMGQRVGTQGGTGASLLGGDLRVSPAAESQFSPSVAFGAGRYLVTWTNDVSSNAFQFDLFGAQVSPDGQVQPPFAISTAPQSQGSREAGISFDGENFLVVFDDARDTTRTFADISGARVSKSGVLLDGPPESGGILISTDPGAGSPSTPKVSFDGNVWLVVWSGGQTKGARVARSGDVLDAQATDLSLSNSIQFSASLAFGIDGFLVTWRRAFTSPTSIHAQLVAVASPNEPPVGDAGTDRVVDESELVTLDGSGSSDPEGDTLSYSWKQVAGPSVMLQDAATVSPTFEAPEVGPGGTELVFELVVDDGSLESLPDQVVVTVLNVNEPPDCTSAKASPESLRPPNHKLVPVDLLGVSDPDGDPVTIHVDRVVQDEPVSGGGSGNTAPDARLSADQLWLRAERSGQGDGRVYRISLTAEDGAGGFCTATVVVCVPHNRGKSECVAGGEELDSLNP